MLAVNFVPNVRQFPVELICKQQSSFFETKKKHKKVIIPYTDFKPQNDVNTPQKQKKQENHIKKTKSQTAIRTARANGIPPPPPPRCQPPIPQINQ